METDPSGDIVRRTGPHGTCVYTYLPTSMTTPYTAPGPAARRRRGLTIAPIDFVQGHENLQPGPCAIRNSALASIRSSLVAGLGPDLSLFTPCILGHSPAHFQTPIMKPLSAMTSRSSSLQRSTSRAFTRPVMSCSAVTTSCTRWEIETKITGRPASTIGFKARMMSR